MQVVSLELKDLKISFSPAQEQLFLGDLLKITDANEIGVIAQIYNLKTHEQNPEINIAECQIILSVAGDDWLSWQGNTLSAEFNIQPVLADEMLSDFNKSATSYLNIGTLSTFGAEFNLDINTFKNPLTILTDSSDERVNINKVLLSELANNGFKTLLLDFKGEYKDINAPIIKAGKDFKLPLDSKRIDSIYAKGLIEASAETKAVIEDIFMQVQQYADQCEDGFIPFSSFKTVVDNEYKSSQITELVLLKNSLAKYDEQGIFTDSTQEIVSLNLELQNNNAVIVDLSDIPIEWHKDFTEFIVSFATTPCHILFEGRDLLCNEFINKLYTTELINGVTPFITLDYGNKQAVEILPYTKTLTLFKPIISTNILPMYDRYLSKLDFNEFIFCSGTTKYIPLFVTPKSTNEIQPIGTKEVQPETIKEETTENPFNQFKTAQEVSPQEIESYQSTANTENNQDYLDFYETQENIEIDNTVEIPSEEALTYSTQDHIKTEPIERYNEPIEISENIVKPESASESGYMSYESEEVIQQQQVKQAAFDEPEQEMQFEDEEIIEFSEDDLDFEDEDFAEIEIKQDYVPQTITTATPAKEAAREEDIAKDVDTLYSTEHAHTATLPNQEIPVYPAGQIGANCSDIPFEEGDMVRHKKYGTGIIKKIIGYGNKKLCSIQFDKVGRRLLDPELAALEKI